MPIEEVASWHWQKKYSYAIAIGAAQEEPDMPDNVRDGDIPSQSHGNMSSGMGSKVPTQPQNTDNGTHPSVAEHDHVVNIDNGN